MAQKQTGRDQFTCEACGGLFDSRDELEKHEKNCAGRGARKAGRRGRSGGRSDAEHRGD